MIWRWAFIRLVLVCGCSWVGALAAHGGPEYDLNRRIEPMDPFGSGAATAQNLYERAIRLSGIVPGEAEVAMVSNRLVEREGAALGFATESAAWSNAWLSARTTYHAHPWVDNAGWISKTTTDKDGAWSAYTYHLQNELWFRPATSVWYSPAAGVTARIVRVLVDSLGDWCLPLQGADVPLAHHLGPVWTNGPRGYIRNESVTLRPDLRTYYKIMPELFWPLNDSDGDNDGIPGFADGFNLDGIPGNADDHSSGDHLLPWRITIPDHLDPACVTIQLTYQASPPHEASTWLTPNNPTFNPTGPLRIWKIDASGNRTYLAPGSYTPESLGVTDNKATLHLEPVKPAASTLASINLVASSPTCAVENIFLGNNSYDALRVNFFKVDIAMDGNRDDSITFGNTNDNHYLFWVNNDHDQREYLQTELIWVEDDTVGDPDCDNDYIGNNTEWGDNSCKRDLEDFTRLHIRVDATTANQSGITYFMKFENTSGMSPAVNIFEAVGKSSAYLFDTNVANQQILKTKLLRVTTNEIQLSNQYIKPGDQVSPFLLEGAAEGKGDLTIIMKKNGKEVCRAAVSMELHKMPWFYDVYSVGVISGDRWEVQIPATASHTQTATYSPATEETFLLVHGWNMTDAEKAQWIETTFKRLWWQGYQGSVALFSWPTLAEYGGPWDVLTDPHHFDNSEFRSWLSSEALATVFKDLNPGGSKLRVLAHSMGNVVAGEALRRYSGPLIHTYIACQAALSAHYYDNTIADKHPCGHQFVHDPLFPSTPDIIGHFSTGDVNSAPYLRGNSQHVANMQNFYNALDWALDLWEINNVRRPDGWAPYSFSYRGREDRYSEGTDKFIRNASSSTPETLRINHVRQRYMIFSYCAESRSKALGQTENSIFSFWNLELSPARGGMGYDAQHYSHSREFRSNIVDEWDFWKRVFRTSQFEK